MKYIDITMTPQMLYNRLPQPLLKLTLQSFARSFLKAGRASLWTCLGQWKNEWNVGLHRVRMRARNLTQEAYRGHYDQHDYEALQGATVMSLAAALRWLPVGVLPAAMLTCMNDPPLKHHDKSMDILDHKLAESIDKGMDFKDAERRLRNSVASSAKHVRQQQATRCIIWVLRMLGMVMLSCLLLMSSVLSESNAPFLAPILCSTLTCTVVLRCFLGTVVLPMVRLQHGIIISVRREVPEEKHITTQILEALEEKEASLSEWSSSGYSSAGESFLLEDPRGTSGTKVLGLENQWILLRPKAKRLHLRFSLLRSLPTCTQYAQTWEREDPLKHGRLLQVPNVGLKKVRRLTRTVSFRPTEDSDWPLKVRRHGLRRSHSLGTSIPQVLPERRWKAEPWSGFVDILDESKLPTLPVTASAMPPRGLVDEFERRHVFLRQRYDLTNQELSFPPLRETLQHAATDDKPWEESLDEALESYKPGGEFGPPLGPDMVDLPTLEEDDPFLNLPAHTPLIR